VGPIPGRGTGGVMGAAATAQAFSNLRHESLTGLVQTCKNSGALSQTDVGAIFLPNAKG